MSFITGKEDVRYNSSVILGKNYSRKCEINTKIGKYSQALTDSRAAIMSLDDWPIELVKHYKIESDLFLYTALYVLKESYTWNDVAIRIQGKTY